MQITAPLVPAHLNLLIFPCFWSWQKQETASLRHGQE